MKEFKIKIIGCSVNENMWYSGKLGRIYERCQLVKLPKDHKNAGRLVYKIKGQSLWIYPIDAKILEVTTILK